MLTRFFLMRYAGGIVYLINNRLINVNGYGAIDSVKNKEKLFDE